MRKLSIFTFITLNGRYKGPNDDLSWHQHGQEENEYASSGLGGDGTLLFGRVTYEMMAGYWPTPAALADARAVAEGMNNAEKIVFSKTLKKASWNNSRIATDLVGEVKKLKQMPGDKSLTVLGSGSIITQLAGHGLVDEYQVMIDPVIIAGGTSVFPNIGKDVGLKLIGTRTFKSGVVLLNYKPKK